MIHDSAEVRAVIECVFAELGKGVFGIGSAITSIDRVDNDGRRLTPVACPRTGERALWSHQKKDK